MYVSFPNKLGQLPKWSAQPLFPLFPCLLLLEVEFQARALFWGLCVLTDFNIYTGGWEEGTGRGTHIWPISELSSGRCSQAQPPAAFPPRVHFSTHRLTHHRAVHLAWSYFSSCAQVETVSLRSFSPGEHVFLVSFHAVIANAPPSSAHTCPLDISPNGFELESLSRGQDMASIGHIGCCPGDTALSILSLPSVVRAPTA